MQVRAQAPVQPTEDPGRVEEAVARFLPGAAVVRETGRIVATGRSLETLQQRVWELRIIDTFRGPLLAGADGRTLRFTTSKQAAFAGRVSIPPTPHVLGDIDWVVHLDEGDAWADAEALAWWLCPPTREGQIVED